MRDYQEALDELFDNATNGEPLYVKQKYFNGIKECKDELQELVDKATPMKPDKHVLLERDHLGFPTQGYCKKCGTSLLVKNNYCGRCGQALDWSKND